MNKHYLLILCIAFVCFAACKLPSSNSNISMQADSVKYTAFRWSDWPNKDSYELYIDYHIAIDNKGNYNAMRHAYAGGPVTFIKGTIADSVRMQINNLASDISEPTYFDSSTNHIYGGNTFLMNVYGKENRKTAYHKHVAPDNLQEVSSILDSIIFKSKNPTPPFNLSSYAVFLENNSFKRREFLPKKEIPNIKIQSGRVKGK